jgi:signal transduction histidine kinase
MKKSNTILLLIIQVTAVFVFSNIFSLFKPLEIREKAAIKEKSDLTAELYTLKYQADIYRMKDAGFFADISFEAGIKASRYTIETDKAEIYVVKIPSTSRRTLVFKKPVESLILTLLKKLKKTFSTLSIVFGIFLIFTGFYLIFLFKKEKDFDVKKLPPLQDYLLKLKGSEMELKDMVRKQQESVTTQDELNKSIINNINAAVLFVNPSGRIEIFNQVAEDIFSRSYAHAKNNDINVVLQKFPHIIRFFEAYKEKTASCYSEIEENEKIFRVDLITVETINKLIIVKDITEAKNRETIDRRNKNFVMLGEMTAFLAHEVRNSLGVIYGYTRTIIPGKGEIKKERLSNKVDKVNKEINFLSSMMESFLNFAKPIKVEKKEKINLTTLVKKIAEENKIDVKISAGNIFIENDKALISSVFSNLLLNAKEAGANRVDIKNETGENEYIEISVKDNGSGIDDKARDKIWYPFFTTKKKGTGMGLAIIRKILNSLNGDISLLDSGSRGAAFKITFYC